jgi:hypothetical protein
MLRRRVPPRRSCGCSSQLALTVSAVVMTMHVRAFEAPPCSIDCVCEESDGGGKSWDLSAISGTYTTTDEDEREYWLDVCGDVDDVPDLCLEATPTIDAAMVMRTDESFCNQLGPSFDALPSDDLVVTATGDGARLLFGYTSQASGQRRTLTLSLLCDPEATGSSPNEAVCDDEECNDVSVDWLTETVCDPDPDPDPDLPPPPPPPPTSVGELDWVYYLSGSLGLAVCVSGGAYVSWRRGGDTDHQSFNKAPVSATQVMPWSKREKKKKSSRHGKKSVRKSEYEPIPALATAPTVSSSAVKAASKDHIGLLSGGRLRGEDRYPKKSDMRRWSGKKQTADIEAEAEGESEVVPERTDGLGRRGGRLTMGADVVCEIDAVTGRDEDGNAVGGSSSKRKGRSWGRTRKHKRPEEKPRPSSSEQHKKDPAEGAPFVASPNFDGARRGYEYKGGALGVGYYKERPAQSAVL